MNRISANVPFPLRGNICGWFISKYLWQPEPSQISLCPAKAVHHMWKLWIRILGNLALIGKEEEKCIPIFQHIKGDSLWTSWFRTKSNSSADLSSHKNNQTKGSYFFHQVTCWTSVKSYSWPVSKKSGIIMTLLVWPYIMLIFPQQV